MGFVFEDGKDYIRPGVYRRATNADNRSSVVSAIDGIGALAIQADWGPLNEVTTHYADTFDKTLKELYGEGGTTKVATAYMDGGLNTLYLTRLGTGGKCGSIILKAGETDAITLTLKYPGTRKFTASIRNKLSAEPVRELAIYEEAEIVEIIEFSGEDEVKSLTEAIKANSQYVSAEAAEGVTGILTDILQQEFTGGENPTITNDCYNEAFKMFNPYYFNTIALDTVDSDVQALLKAYLNEIAVEGGLGIAVIGESGEKDLSTRMKNATDNNDPTIVYFGSDVIEEGSIKLSAPEAIAIAAGVIASTPSSQSVTHRQMPRAVKLAEHLSYTQYSDAIKSGLLLLSADDDGTVMFDSGVNTLSVPNDNQDEGWKKIKRVKVRHEAYNRVDRTLNKLIGKVLCNKDGIANVIQKGQEVLDEMVKETKIANASFTLDTQKGYGADYGYFNISFDDIDTLERIFLTYRFRYNANS